MALAAAAGATLQIVSAYKAKKAEKQAGIATKKMYDYNAAIEEQNANSAEQQGKYEARRKRQDINRLLSTQRAITGAAGITFSGTPTLVAADTASEGELDAMMIQHNAGVTAARYRQSASILRWQGKTELMLSKRRANAKFLAGIAGAGSSAGTAYMSYKKDGGWMGPKTPAPAPNTRTYGSNYGLR